MTQSRISMRLPLLILVTFFTALFFPARVLSQADTLTIVHVSDTHSHLVPFGPKDDAGRGTVGGIARVATIIGSIKRSTSNVVALHGGDFFQGDMMFNVYLGVPELEILNRLGFDAMAVGNHEFDISPATLESTLAQAFESGGFPLLSANLVLDGYASLDRFVLPSIVKRIGNLRVGIFGMTTPMTNVYSHPAPVIVDSNVVQIAAAAVESLRAQDVDLIILLSHLGVELERLIASSVAGIDIVLSGHDHVAFKQPEVIQNPSGITWHVASGSHYRHVARLTMEVGSEKLRIIDYHLIPVDSTVREEAMTAAFVDTLLAGVEGKFGEFYFYPVAFAESDIDEVPHPDREYKDTPLGNLICDAFRSATNTHIALTAGGFISEKIFKGVITAADIFRTVSYGYDPATALGFKLATFELLGKDLVKGLEFGIADIEHSDEYFVQVSGMSFAYDPTKPRTGGQVDVESIRIDGKPLDPLAYYTVTTTEGIVEQLGLVGLSPVNLRILDIHEFTAVKDYIVRLDTVRYVSEGRIVDLLISTGGDEERSVPDSHERY